MDELEKKYKKPGKFKRFVKGAGTLILVGAIAYGGMLIERGQKNAEISELENRLNIIGSTKRAVAKVVYETKKDPSLVDTLINNYKALEKTPSELERMNQIYEIN